MCIWPADRRSRRARVQKPDIAFTNRIRKALSLAQKEAIRLKHDFVGTEHILLGLIREDGGMAGAVLECLEVDLDHVRIQVEESVRPGRAPVELSELPYTSRAKKVLEFAVAEARVLNHSYVGTEHLLLGLLREEKGIAAEVLNGLGVSLEGARRATLELLRQEEAPGMTFRFSIDDVSSESIYEQLVAQVTEAVATGRLRAEDRLPPVRQAADELDIAPGTVARAYSELERLGVVVTEGARGTRVAQRERSSLPEGERAETLVGLMRPTAVAGFHLGATADELRSALEQAMEGIF